ncbi:MAG: lamin tail domain-containing protein [Planctomycetes bacterium]|jgi:hypothetical protein|nr:lamin tail domain-containing protein [Planctomycetota bacterium]
MPYRTLRRGGAALLAALSSPLAGQAVADTQFSIDRGLHYAAFPLTISTLTPGASIRYTLDCSDPRTSATAITGLGPVTLTIDPVSNYGGARPITPAVVVRAYAFAAGLLPTDVDTVTYVFPPRVLVQNRPAGFTTAVQFDMDPLVLNNPLYSVRILADLASLPTLSVVGNATQIFGTNGVVRAPNGSIEVPGSIEIVHPDGRDDQVDCGLTPHSWQQNKRSMRIYLRQSYGADKWRHDLFRDSAEGTDSGVRSFDGLVLRAGFNDGLLYGDAARAGRYSFAVDDQARSSQLAMTGFGARGTFVHLYLNGLYWGLYNPVERPESSYWSDWFGGSKDDYFARNHGGPVDGTATWYQGMVSAAANWTTLQARLDVPSFCDYILGWTWCGGGDWPSYNGANNNWYAGNRNLPTPGRVRFFSWDAEDSWINLPGRPGPPADGARIVNELLTGPLDISILWRGAQAQTDFRLQWADRVYKHCYNDGALSEANTLARWNRITKVVDRGVVGESARWGRFDPRGVTWTRNADWQPYTDQVRQMFVGNRPQLVAALRNTQVPSPHPALYPSLEPPLFQVGSPATTIEVTKGVVAPGTVITLVRPTPIGTVYYTTDGSDPRGPTGAPTGQIGGTGAFVIAASPRLMLRARLLLGSEWSALHELELDVRNNPRPVELHEVLAENVAGLGDEMGDRDDWIELHNPSLVDHDLSGHHLTDDLGNPTKWTLPAGTVLRAGASLLVWADNEPAEGLLHATFRLSGLGEAVGLFAPGGAVAIDQWTFGNQRDDVSIGRLSFDPDRLVTMPRPTPSRRNAPQPCGHLAFQAADSQGGLQPLRGLGVPTVGDSLRFELEDQPPLSIAVLALGTAAQQLPVPGLGTVLVDPVLLLSALATADGEARFELPLPDQPSLRGMVVVAQAAGDVGGTLQLSNGVVSRICD